MRRGATREEIIRTTQDLITRNGIRAVRVDEIAQTLGISKRTLYEMFTDKTDLVSACLDDMQRRQQQWIEDYRKSCDGTPLQQAVDFMRKYIDGLYSVDGCFLSEVRHKIDFLELFENHMAFCHGELTRILNACQQTGFLLSEIVAKNLSDLILDTLLDLRINQATYEEAILFCRTMLRGIATKTGIEQIDQHT